MICMFKAIHYCQLIYLKTFKVCVFKYMYELDSARFLTAPVLAWQAAFNKTIVELDLYLIRSN